MAENELPPMTIDKAVQYYIDNFIGEEVNQAIKNKGDSYIPIDYTDFQDCIINITTKCEGDKYFESINTYEDMEATINKMKGSYNIENGIDNDGYIYVRAINIPNNVALSYLCKDHITKSISTTAMIKNMTPISENLVKSVFHCKSCGHIFRQDSSGTCVFPVRCPTCHGKEFELDEEACRFEDYRIVKLEEPLELRNGGTTREFLGHIKGYQASPNYHIKPGDTVDVIGEVRTVYDEKKGKYDLFIDVHSITPLNSSYEDVKITDGDIEEIKQLSQQPNIFERFTLSIAPTVHGYEEIKKGLVCQMFEGAKINPDDKNDRPLIHMLLLGDPGTGKSKVIEDAYEHSPKAIRSNGAGTSQAGLTASAVRDERIGSWTMEAGAEVLADGGLLTIDEFDKLSPNVMTALNEPMEQLSVSVAKAGLVQTMSARTSVLAGANPKYGRYIEEKSFKDQVEIPTTTMSRFDLVYLIKDEVNYDKDKDLAEKILRNERTPPEYLIPDDIMAKYVSYAKSRVKPVLTSEAIDKLAEFFAEVRTASLEIQDSKMITLRELGAIRRIAFALAKVELREECDIDDVSRAIDIYNESLKTLGLDIFHSAELVGGFSEEDLHRIEFAEDLIKEQLGIFGNNITKSDCKEIKLQLKREFSMSDDVTETIFDEAFCNVVAF